MKKKIFFLTVFLLLLNSSLVTNAQNDNKNEEPTKWKHFTIYVKASDNPLFVNLSKELGLGILDKDELDIEYYRGLWGEYALGGLFQLVVNIKDPNPQNHYVVIGKYGSKDVEKDPKALRFAWSQLSKETQEGLLQWNKDNKFEGEKKIVRGAEDTDNPRSWTYFKILVRTEDDSIFYLAQDDMGIEPKLESYTLVINISDPNAQNQYVILGDELDPSAMRFDWDQFSKTVQEGLINWTGVNKENLNNFDYKDILEQYTQIININKGYSKLYYIYYLRGIVNIRLSKYESAIKDLNYALTIKEDFANGYIERGHANWMASKYKDAIKDFDKALTIDPENVKAYEYRGQTYLYMNKYKKAISDLEQAVKLARGYNSWLQSLIDFARERMK